MFKIISRDDHGRDLVWNKKRAQWMVAPVTGVNVREYGYRTIVGANRVVDNGMRFDRAGWRWKEFAVVPLDSNFRVYPG